MESSTNTADDVATESARLPAAPFISQMILPDRQYHLYVCRGETINTYGTMETLTITDTRTDKTWLFINILGRGENSRRLLRKEDTASTVLIEMFREMMHRIMDAECCEKVVAKDGKTDIPCECDA